MRILSFNILIVLAILGSACSKVDDACIDAPPYLFFDIKNDIRCCSDSDDYVLWEFEKGESRLGNRLEHKFEKPGKQVIKQTVYSDDARKEDTQEMEATVGFLKVDSIVVTHINTFGLLFESTPPDIYISVEGMESDQIFIDVPDIQTPRTYTFNQNGGIITGVNAQLAFYDYNERRDDFLLAERVAELDLSTFDNPIIEENSTDKFRYRVYWSFVASR